MKRKIIILSVFTTILIILLPISSVIGTNVNINKRQNKMESSPLFNMKISSFTDKNNKKVRTNYLGKDSEFFAFLSKRSSLNEWIDKSIQIISNKPFLLQNTFQKIQKLPQFKKIIEKYEISNEDFTDYISMVKNNPNILDKQIKDSVEIIGEYIFSQINDPEPLGFSGQVGCLIGFFIVFPIILMIGTMLATFTILTCLNINGCFETLMTNLLEEFSQGLITP